MLRILQWIFCGHVHKWKIIRENPLRVRDRGREVALGTRFVQQCETCGTLKVKDTA